MRDVKTAQVAPGRAAVYLEKAERFHRGASGALERGDEETAALSALHAVISAADAITVAKLGLRSTGSEHADVLRLLERCDIRGKEELKKQIRGVVGRKNFVEYDDALLPSGEATILVKQAGRVVAAARAALAPSSLP